MLELNQLTIRRSDFSLGPINLMVPQNAYAVLMGPTGSGKTTLLESIAGLCTIASGKIQVDGKDISRHIPADRHLGYVPQEGVLFPRLTVEQNLAFGLRARKINRQERTHRVSELAEQLGITSLLERRPRTLSGGEKQRVALGRALASRPKLLLLDEPFAALDIDSRASLYDLIRSLRQEDAFTTLHVSHHKEDAIKLADVVFTIDNGCLHNTAQDEQEI